MTPQQTNAILNDVAILLAPLVEDGKQIRVKDARDVLNRARAARQSHGQESRTQKAILPILEEWFNGLGIDMPSRESEKLAEDMAQAIDKSGDAARLDWAMLRSSAQYERDSAGPYVVAYLTSGCLGSNGVSGHFIARGADHRECIDKFLRGEVTRID